MSGLQHRSRPGTDIRCARARIILKPECQEFSGVQSARMGRLSPSGGIDWSQASAVAPEPPIALEPIDCSMCAAVGVQFLMFGTARRSASEPVVTCVFDTQRTARPELLVYDSPQSFLRHVDVSAGPRPSARPTRRSILSSQSTLMWYASDELCRFPPFSEYFRARAV
jgi:hypothetical protein